MLIRFANVVYWLSTSVSITILLLFLSQFLPALFSLSLALFNNDPLSAEIANQRMAFIVLDIIPYGLFAIFIWLIGRAFKYIVVGR